MATYAALNAPFFAPLRHEKKSVVLERKTAAIQMTRDEKGRFQLGLFTHLLPGTTIELCGPGFNQRTVQVRSAESYYLLLLRSTTIS
jgi:hypothetical protein